MKPTILFLITKSNWGGAQRYVFDLATSLRTHYEVHVALGGEGRLRDLLVEHAIPIHQLPHLMRDISFMKELYSFIDTYRLVRRVRPDILHVNSSKAGGLGALAGRLAGVPTIIFTAHAWAWNEDRSFLSKIMIGVLHWCTVMLAHHTICVSHAVHAQMARLPFTRARMSVIHLGITPLPRISKEVARDSLRTTLTNDIPADTLWIGTIAELHPIKGLTYAIRAIQQLKARYPRLHYTIIGSGQEKAALEKLIQTLHLTDTVSLAGHINDASVLLPAFDIFILPSLSEAFGYVLLEAGGAEVPVIASRVGGIPEIITKETGVLVPPKDTDSLRDAIATLLATPHTRDHLKVALAKRVETHFSKERMVSATKALYDSRGS